ncbi:MAG: BON domain-containing protein [Chloroflexota bacterium]|nr:BON domain-containing protein [Chloroflexota bacterium]
MEQRDDRLPLPSEDGGDLVNEPPTGVSDDPLVATEEGVPYTPPTDRVLSQTDGPEGPDVAGTAPDDAGELERVDGIQVPNAARPVDDELNADVIEALRDSDVTAGDRIRVATEGRRVTLTGEVETMDALDEIVGIVGDVEGVDEVVDEVSVTAV